ncbi:MAG: ribosomal protein S18-alanine N-acetyltransferase [Pseudomonadota bacterium]|jgi:ribosomal-protein-alanine N-acetyltransferase
MLRDADDLTTIADLLPLRPMTLVDLDTVMVIEERAYPFPWTRRNFQDCLKQGYLCQVYEQDDKIMAYAVVMLVLDEMHLLNICVDPSLQGQRFGSRLLRTMEHHAAVRQAQTCFLEVRQSNFAAIRLYLNAGFNEVGLRKAYYPAKLGREDAIVMAKTLL